MADFDKGIMQKKSSRCTKETSVIFSSEELEKDGFPMKSTQRIIWIVYRVRFVCQNK